MKYNLIRNGHFYGSGDHTFTWTDLEILQDGNTTSSGVTVSGVNDLTTDLSQRIKVDGIRLYASDLTKSSNIHFYYKNLVSDEYSLLSTSVGAYYYTTIPEPSAPRYIKVVTSGISLDLYEFQIFNNDYIVAFGEDGQQYIEYLEDTPIGEEGNPQAIPVYNNSDLNMPANAYTCVDYSGAVGDDYIELSSSINGTYYSIDDGAIIEDDQDYSAWRWRDGTYVNTEVVDHKVVVEGTPGVYKGQLPLNNASNSFNTAEHCWDNGDNNKIYAVGSDGILKLWEYYVDTNIWTYIGEISPGCTGHAFKATMCYMDDYIYCLTDGNQSFGRYDLNGVQDNWEALPSHPVAETGSNPRRNICSDYNRYIYCVDFSRWSIVARLYRYDTTTSGWSSLNAGYTIGQSDCYASWFSLAYDGDDNRNYLYLLMGLRNNNHYIQRYDIDLDTWNTTYFYTGDIDGNNEGSRSLSYYGGNIWFASNGSAGKLFKYNVTTSELESMDVSFTFFQPGDCTYSVYMIAYGDKIYCSQINGDRGGLYVYDASSLLYGSYTTPMFKLDNKYESSSFITRGITSSGTGSISYDENTFNGSIRVRSSDIDPVPMYFSCILYTYASDSHVVLWYPYDGTYIDRTHSLYNRQHVVLSAAVDWQNGNYCINWSQGYYDWDEACYVSIYNKEGSAVYSITTGYNYLFNDKMEFEGEHGLWVYGNYNTSASRKLRHFDSDLSIIYTYSESQTDFLYDMTTEYTSRGCWYTNSLDNTLVHMSSVGGKLSTIVLPSPRYVARTLDNGVYVYDSSLIQILRYNSSGVKVSEFDVPTTDAYGSAVVNFMYSDFNNGFWYRHGDYVRHVTEAGQVDVGPVFVADCNQLRGAPDGCFAYSNDDNLMYWIDMEGNKTSRAMPGGAASVFGGIYYNYDSFESFKNHYIPISADPVWGTGGSLEWEEVSKDGYFLPKVRYHQAEITIRGDAELEKLVMAPAVRTEDISPKQSKNIYIKTNIPIGVDVTDYTSRLRTWWGVQD